MATVADVYRFLDQKAPFSLQMSFDNAGFLVGRGETPITKILVALDITEAVMQEAVDMGANLIVAHHPVIWDRCAAVTSETLTGKKLLFLIEHQIAAICAHTNLDAVEGGVNTVLANRFQLENQIPLHTDGLDQNGKPYGIGRVGNLTQAIAFSDFIQTVKEKLQIPAVRAADHGKAVYRVAVGGGACGGMLQDAFAQ
ncbi:MAG: Nif3-like dinuclear metal center hexameric protein, partial [Evtepia sp.]